MTRLLVTMYRIYFYHPAIAWIVATAGLIAFYSLSQSGLFALTSRLLAISLITSIPAVAVVTQFGSALSNRQLSMIPNGRRFLLGATFCLLVSISALFAWNWTSIYARFANAPDFAEMFLFYILLLSIGLVLSSSPARVKVFLPLALVIVIFRTPLGLLWDRVAVFEPPVSYVFLLLLILSCWAWLLWDLRRPVAQAKSGRTLFDVDKVLDLIGHFGRIFAPESTVPNASNNSIPIPLSATKTLFYGVATAQSSRNWFAMARFVVLPLVALMYVWIFLEPEVWGEALLLVQFFVLISLPINAANWVATMRTLWLRVAGDRIHFWRTWEGLLHADLLLSMLILSLYLFVVQAILDVSDLSLALYAVITIIALPATCYAATWFQLAGAFGRVLTVWSGILYVSAIVVLIMATYVTRNWVPIVVLATISTCVGLAAYLRVRKGFEKIDWLQIRPIRQPQL